MAEAYICDAVRTPIGRYGGALSAVRTDDLGAVPIAALMARNEGVDWASVDDVYYGNANQAGEDNRNVARMSGLLAGLPIEVGGRRSIASAAPGWTRWRRRRARSGWARPSSRSRAGSRACRARRS